jgi:hypothetical protein
MHHVLVTQLASLLLNLSNCNDATVINALHCTVGTLALTANQIFNSNNIFWQVHALQPAWTINVSYKPPSPRAMVQ